MLNILKSTKQNILIEELFARIKGDLDLGEQVVLIVPAQASLAMEQKAFELLGGKGFFSLRIIRGQKLHQEILNESGWPQQTSVNTIGRRMLLRKIVCDEKENLRVFGSLCKDSGFLDIAGDFIVQLKQNNLSPEDLDALCSGAQGSFLADKLSDMKIISAAYDAALAGKFTDSENMLAFVTERVKNSSFVKASKIYYYGFYSFTAREIDYLAELEKYSEGLCIALLSGCENYAVTAVTESKLLKKMPGESYSVCTESYSLPAKDKYIFKCVNPYAQAATIASEIRRLVRSRGYRYSDIAVLCGASEETVSTLKRVFSMYDIPVFADEKRSVLHSSALEAVSAALDMARAGFRTSDIIRFLKSGVLPVSEDAVCLFENYAKLYHIKGSKLHEPLRYGKKEYTSEEFAVLESTRAAVSAAITGFADDVSLSETVLQKAECLYRFLSEKICLPDVLNKLSEEQVNDGFLDAAEESSQIWNSIVSVLEQMTELIGSEKMNLDDFTDMLMSSFAELKVGVLPQAEGKIQLGTVIRSHLEGVKALFIAGFNEGVVPSDAELSGVLTEEENSIVQSRGITLFKDSDTLSMEEEYGIYSNLACGMEYLGLLYSISDLEGSDTKPSHMLDDLDKKYGPFERRSDIESDDSLIPFLEGKAMAQMRVASSLRGAMQGESIGEGEKLAYNLLKGDMDEIRAGLRYSNKQKALGPQMSRDLFAYKGEFSFSPSRMDKFAGCAFKHFINYGLKPREQDEFAMNGGSIGTLYHEVLMRLCAEIKDWKAVSSGDVENLVDKYLEEISSGEMGELINSTASSKYTSKRVRSVCKRFARFMAEQLRKENIEEMLVETEFGRGKTLPPVEILCSGGKVYVEGKIDRIDVCPGEDEGKYIRIVDYKSGNTTFHKNLIEAGLSLQLMIYFEGAIENYPEESSGGVYYFNIKDPQVAASLQDLPADELSEKVLEAIRKNYKLSGQDVDAEFRENFRNTLSALCERLTMGDISPTPKKVGYDYDSCQYCKYNYICQKDIC